MFKWFLLIAFLFTYGSALYEDQVGKFDWNAKHLGCFNQIFFGKASEHSDEFLLASTEKNALGRLNPNTGDLIWRQIGEENIQAFPEFLVNENRILTSMNNGEHYRSFDLETGTLKWQFRIQRNSTERPKFDQTRKIVGILSESTLFGFLLSNRGERIKSKWTTKLDDESKWIQIFVKEEGANFDASVIFVVGITNKHNEIRVVRVNAKTGAIENMNRLAADSNLDRNSCILSKNYLICSSISVSETIEVVALDITSTHTLQPLRTTVKAKSAELGPMGLASNENSYFFAHSSRNTQIFKVEEQEILQVLSVERSNVISVSDSVTTPLFTAYYETTNLAKIYDLKNGNLLATLKLDNSKIAPDFSSAPLAKIRVVASQSGGHDSPNETPTTIYQVLVTRKDCRVEFYEAVSPNKQNGEIPTNMDWVRFEGLAEISNVEMLDLPLSESQARIETEFGSENEAVIKSFFLRVNSQLEQLRRLFPILGQRFAESFELLTRKQTSVTNVLRHLVGYDIRTSRKSRTATISLNSAQKVPLERDYFNLQKLIIATSLSGSVYAINSGDGEVIWSLYLGEDAQPFHNQLQQPKIPLFIQRDTTHFQFNSQAAVVFNSRTSPTKSTILFFNPTNGNILENHKVDHLKRVEMFPFTNSENLHPLIVVREDIAKSGLSEQVEIHPEFPTHYEPPYPVYLMFLDRENGRLKGAQLDLSKKALIQKWETELGFLGTEKIISVAGKPLSQKMHSQGRVLGNRSVLYKYANPNLVAVASADKEQLLVKISLVDAVTGQIVYVARQSRALPPINLVHCENWITYTYWNEKARRTELGVIELYEGLEQTDPEKFDAYSGIKNPLQVFVQSYVFAQGVSAMAASETEQGLSTRSVIIAMPFGGVLEISRRFIDARRPLELTPEMREEMIIPYMPELPIATEDLINYNQTVLRVRGIKTGASGLESTSLVFVYGLDLFYTRVTPSGTFDILKDDFDYVLIALVMVVLVVASVVCKRIWRYSSLKQAWN